MKKINNFRIGQQVKAYDQKGQGYYVGTIEEFENLGRLKCAVIRPERKVGNKGNFHLDFVIRNRVLSITPLSFIESI